MNKCVLFICTGNICRSPMAEGMFRALVEETGEDIIVASAGVGAMDGYPPSENSQIAMAEIGIDISMQRSRALTARMVEEASHIFGMSKSHIDVIRSYFPASVEKTFVLRELIAKDVASADIHDPIGGDLDEYRQVRDEIREAMPGIVKFVVSGEII